MGRLPDRLARYTRADELHTAFNFSFVRAPWEPTT
jgi:alpha-glucosidase